MPMLTGEKILNIDMNYDSLISAGSFFRFQEVLS